MQLYPTVRIGILWLLTLVGSKSLKSLNKAIRKKVREVSVDNQGRLILICTVKGFTETGI